jgi:hypothetical protein
VGGVGRGTGAPSVEGDGPGSAVKPWGWSLIGISIAVVVGVGVAAGIYFGIVRRTTGETDVNDAEKQGVQISTSPSIDSPNGDEDEAGTHPEEDKPMPGEPVDPKPVAPSKSSPEAGNLPCSQTPQLTALETTTAVSSEPFCDE